MNEHLWGTTRIREKLGHLLAYFLLYVDYPVHFSRHVRSTWSALIAWHCPFLRRASHASGTIRLKKRIKTTYELSLFTGESRMLLSNV